MKYFSKLVTIDSDDGVTVDLKDTNGDLISCNWVEVTNCNTIVNDFLFVEAVGLGAVSASSNSLDNTGPTTAGLCGRGVCGSTGRQHPAVLDLGGLRITQVKIFDGGGADGQAVVNYGVKTEPSNWKSRLENVGG